MIKRNSIVLIGSFYGRVIKKLPENRFLVLCCGLHFHSVGSDYPESDYKGYIDTRGKFVKMTSIRTLKKLAARYHGSNAHNTPNDYEFINQR